MNNWTLMRLANCNSYEGAFTVVLVPRTLSGRGSVATKDKPGFPIPFRSPEVSTPSILRGSIRFRLNSPERVP